MKNIPKIFDKIQNIGNSSRQQVYCITGDDEYLRESAIKRILKKNGDSGNEHDSVIRFFGEDIDRDELNVHLVSYSLFSETKTIIIKNAAKMSQGCWEVIRRALENPVEGTTVILEDEKFDMRSPHVKSVVQSACRIEFPKIYDDQLLEWLQWYAKRLNMHLSADAVVVLRESCEPKMRHLINELEKIKLFVTDKKELSADDILDIVQTNRGFNIFEFTNSLFELENTKKLDFLKKIFLFNESVPGIIVMIARHLTIILKIKLYNNKGADRKALEKVTGSNRFFLNRYVNQSKLLSKQSLNNLFEATLEADKNLKTGFQSDKVVLTLLIYRFHSALAAGTL